MPAREKGEVLGAFAAHKNEGNDWLHGCGEEFAVLLTQTDKSRATAPADSLRHIVERTRFFGEGARLTISIGVATIPVDAGTSAALVRAADRALYQAKSAGRNQVRVA